jgi:serine/threonine protein phosphatase PrpC
MLPDAAEKLLAIAKENGGLDNISIITIKIIKIEEKEE